MPMLWWASGTRVCTQGAGPHRCLQYLTRVALCMTEKAIDTLDVIPRGRDGCYSIVWLGCPSSGGLPAHLTWVTGFGWWAPVERACTVGDRLRGCILIQF